MLNLGRLKVLQEVASRGSFSAAAEALTYTQSAVSQAIARLEAETGATLLVRDRRGVRPTAAGATLLEDPMHVALPGEHPLAAKPALTLSDLRDQDWVQTSSSSPCARHVVRSCLAAGFEPHVTFESDDYETVQGLVAAGVGVALIPRLALTHVHPGIVVRALAPRSPARKVTAATTGGVAAVPAAHAMIRILREVAGRYASEERPTSPVAVTSPAPAARAPSVAG